MSDGDGGRVVPALLAGDLARTEAFYAGLGFATYRLPGGRLEVARDGVRLLFYTDPPRGTPTAPALSGTIYAFAGSVDALAAEWRDAVAFLWGPELMPYGLYELGIVDPDGYHLAFAERPAPVG
jgi:hypothetical protein